MISGQAIRSAELTKSKALTKAANLVVLKGGLIIMKKYFKKALTVAGSALLVGSTIGMAAAAAYPTPFIQGGNANVAVVYGSNAALSDVVGAADISTDLATELAVQTAEGGSVGGSTVTGGDAFAFEKATTKLNLGDGLRDVIATTLDEDELPTILAKGTYTDDDNDEFDFKQKIDVANLTLDLFDDNDYKRDTPTVGIKVADGANVLNYTLDFTETPLWADLTSTDITLLGKSYYVLSTASNNTLNLLDSADDTILSEGETVTLNGREVSVNYMDGTEVILTIDGENTNTLEEGETQKLSDGAYIGVKDILYSSKEGTVGKVEFSIGSGKLVVKNNAEVEMNDEDVDGLTATITNSGSEATEALDTIKLVWNSEDETFIAEDSDAVMPGFGALKLSYAGMLRPAEETFVVENDGNDNIVISGFDMESNADQDITILEANGTDYTLVGKDSDNKLATVYGDTNLTFTEGTHDFFVLSYKSGDEAESYLVRAASFADGADGVTGNSSAIADDTVKIEYMADGSWVEAEAAAEVDDIVEIGSASMVVESVNDSSNTLIVNPSTSNNFHMLYSEEGLEVWLPWVNETEVTIPSGTNSTDAANACADAISANLINTTMGPAQLAYNQVVNWQNNTSGDAALTTTCENFPATYTLMFEEENKDGQISSGNGFNLTLSLTGTAGDQDTTVSAIDGESPDGGFEVGEDNEYVSYIDGDLATKILHDTGGDQDYATITYYGGESYGEVFLTSEDATIVGGSNTTSGGTATELGAVTVEDTEVASVQSKNLIVVGGSCINAIAAELLDEAACGADFTAKTDVAAGEFLIESFDNPYTEGKVAMLVAGYNAADTKKAVTYLTNNDVDTTVGTKLKGTSATEATLVTA